MKYQLAIFDFDGTLADSLPHLLRIFNSLAGYYRYHQISVDEISSIRTLDLRQVMKRLHIPFWKLPFILRQVRKRMTAEAGQVGLFPGIDEFLKGLAANGVRLGIVSSNSWINIQRVLGPQMAGLFEFAECNSSMFGKRPKLRKVVRKSGVKATSTIYIGDEMRDLAAAHAEGLSFGAATWGYTPANLFLPHAPQELFESVPDMADKLSRTKSITIPL